MPSSPAPRWTYAALAAGAVAALLHFLAPAIGSRGLADATKVVPMIVLFLLAPVWAPKGGFYRNALMAGFVFSLAGDVFMTRKEWFLFGVASFLVAHLFYIAAFSSGGARLRLVLLTPFALFGVSMGAWMLPHLGDMTIPVLIYILVILSMGWRAAARVGHGGESRAAQWAGLAGAVSFMVSDSVIAINKFIGAVPGEHYIIMATYWAGQFGIAWSMRREIEGGYSPE